MTKPSPEHLRKRLLFCFTWTLRVKLKLLRHLSKLLRSQLKRIESSQSNELTSEVKMNHMNIIGPSYKTKLPWYIILGLILAAAIALISIFFFGAAILGWRPLSLGRFGSQGDFFGGHIAAAVGSITLLIVLLTGYIQLTLDRKFRLREHFLSGISIIGQYDINSAGCEQALRVLDYYSSVALELDDDELLLLLNTVMTNEIRNKLEAKDGPTKDAYLDAKKARGRIQKILEIYNKRRKGLL